MFFNLTILVLSCLLMGAITSVAAKKPGESCNSGDCPQCTLPSDTGPCEALNKAFFFNVSNCQCEEFNWGGCGGNENRYDSIEDCQSECGHIQCPVCNLPPEKGTGSASTQRWNFDAAICACKTFQYGGIRGNLNNFPSEADCEGACGKYPCPVCSQDAQPGNCSEALKRWHYAAEEDRCQAFTWTGCDPNGNNFKKKQECESVCKRFFCTLPVKDGPCKALIPRYYYNPESGMCENFNWGGCDPNRNNFESKEACEKVCIDKN